MRFLMPLLVMAFAFSASSDMLLSEGFEDNWVPDGWAKYNLADVSPYDWSQYDEFVQFGTYCAHHGYDYDNHCEDWLVTPQLDLTGYDSAVLDFYQKQGPEQYYQYTAVWISTGSGDPNDDDFVELEQIQMESGEDEYNWYIRTIALDAYAGEQIYLAFYFDDLGESGTRWDIDEVYVETGQDLEGTTWGGIKAAAF